MSDEILFPAVQDQLSVNERFAQTCDILGKELQNRGFVLTAKPDGRQYWKKDTEKFAVRVLFTLGWTERGTVHVDEMVMPNFVGASTVFQSVYTQPRIERILGFIDSYR
jgi:hypothetical protein